MSEAAILDVEFEPAMWINGRRSEFGGANHGSTLDIINV